MDNFDCLTCCSSNEEKRKESKHHEVLSRVLLGKLLKQFWPVNVVKRRLSVVYRCLCLVYKDQQSGSAIVQLQHCRVRKLKTMQNLSRAAAVGKKMEHKISEPRPAPLPSAPPSSLRPIGSLNLTPEKEQRRKPLAEAQQNHILSPQSSLTPRSKASKVILNI